MIKRKELFKFDRATGIGVILKDKDLQKVSINIEYFKKAIKFFDELDKEGEEEKILDVYVKKDYPIFLTFKNKEIAFIIAPCVREVD